MSLRFWRWFPRRSESSAASKTTDSSVVAGESSPPFVVEQDRKAARYSRLETIATVSVIAGVLAENWDDFGMFYAHRNWFYGRVAVGGVVVAVGIALEILFSSRSSSAERKIRDWYAVKVAELNLRAETEQTARIKLELELQTLRSPRTISAPAHKALSDLLSSQAGKTVDIVVFDHHVPETSFFAHQLVPLFVNAGWKCRQWERAMRRTESLEVLPWLQQETDMSLNSKSYPIH
jgi:hypothetical protein